MDRAPDEPNRSSTRESQFSSSQLTSSTETFNWISNGNAVDNYALWFGTSPGALDLGKSGVLPGSQTSFTMPGLPDDGSTIFVTFFFKLSGDPGYTPVDYQYTAASGP